MQSIGRAEIVQPEVFKISGNRLPHREFEKDKIRLRVEELQRE